MIDDKPSKSTESDDAANADNTDNGTESEDAVNVDNTNGTKTEDVVTFSSRHRRTKEKKDYTEVDDADNDDDDNYQGIYLFKIIVSFSN
jgi:hypothetical protein